MLRTLLLYLFSILLTGRAFAGGPADTSTLSRSGFIMSDINGYATHDSWLEFNKIMDTVPAFDRIIKNIEQVICSTDKNRSVLIVGEPNDTYRYVFARFASKIAKDKCPNFTHAEIDVTKVEAAGPYVGDIEDYWLESVIGPVDQRDGILYFSNLGRLMGTGSHRNDEDGIEAEYVANFTSGRMRTIAYIDKYQYDYFARSRLAYVMNSFARTITMEPIAAADVDQLVQAYLKVLYPNFILTNDISKFLAKTVQYFQPNILEPQRTMTVLKNLIRQTGDLAQVESERTLATAVETAHPHPADTTVSLTMSQPDASETSLSFEKIEMISGAQIYISDADAGINLETITTNSTNYKTKFYKTKNFRINFYSPGANPNNLYGFKISKVTVKTKINHTFTKDEVKKAVMEVTQVPRWIIDRDFTVVKDLRKNLDGDVVGCQESKDDMERLVKAGYVVGRTDEKPIASAMYIGPTGTGKSYLAKRMADFMQMKMITIDMTSYQTPESFDRFLEVVSTNLLMYPFAIYLFEEIDKANPLILDRLYFMLDEGVFYDKFQRPIFARGSFILMTTNAGEDILLRGQRDDPTVREQVNVELRKLFRPSFLNRFDAMSLFFPFTDAEYLQLSKTLITKKSEKLLQNFEWKLAVDQKSIEFIALKGRSPRYGARPMERLIENIITIGLAEFQLEHGDIDPGSIVNLRKVSASNDDSKFAVTANGKTLEFIANTNINQGIMRNHVTNSEYYKKLEKVFQADRLF